MSVRAAEGSPSLGVDTATTDVQEACSDDHRGRPRGAGEGRDDQNLHEANTTPCGRDEPAARRCPPGVAASEPPPWRGFAAHFSKHLPLSLPRWRCPQPAEAGDGGFANPGADEITVAAIIRGVEGPLATVRGGKPEETVTRASWASFRARRPPAQEPAQRREHVTVADLPTPASRLDQRAADDRGVGYPAGLG